MMVHGRSVSRHGHLLVAGWRIGGNLALSAQVAGPAPDLQLHVIVIKDEIPVFVLAAGQGADLQLVT